MVSINWFQISAVKSKYGLHDRDLPLYLSLGLKLVTFHRIFKFKEPDWLKKCFEFNTDKTQKRCQ